jgi:hypothetical protein
LERALGANDDAFNGWMFDDDYFNICMFGDGDGELACFSR